MLRAHTAGVVVSPRPYWRLPCADRTALVRAAQQQVHVALAHALAVHQKPRTVQREVQPRNRRGATQPTADAPGAGAASIGRAAAMRGLNVSRRALIALLAACCVAGAHGDVDRAAYSAGGRRVLAGPSPAPAPAATPAASVSVSSDVVTPLQTQRASPVVATLQPAAAPAAAPAQAPAPAQASVAAAEPAPAPAAAAARSRAYAAAAEAAQQAEAPTVAQVASPPPPPLPPPPAKAQGSWLARFTAPAAVAPGPKPGARPPFATSITGEGGPPIGATPVGSMGTSSACPMCTFCVHACLALTSCAHATQRFR